MNFIYKNLFALPNLRPYTKHNKNLAIANKSLYLANDTRYIAGARYQNCFYEAYKGYKIQDTSHSY